MNRLELEDDGATVRAESGATLARLADFAQKNGLAGLEFAHGIPGTVGGGVCMVSMAWVEGFYNRPRVDLDLLREHHGGLIALTACLAGEVPRRLRSGEYDSAKDYALELAGIFGPEHFYLELQDHGIPEQAAVNRGILKIHQDTGLPMRQKSPTK